MKVIDFESHFLPDALEEALYARDEYPCMDKESKMMHFGRDCHLPYAQIYDNLKDMAEKRIQKMDEAGIDIQIVSSVGATELLPAAEGNRVASEANKALFTAVRRHEDRFRGYAILGTHDIGEAVYELEKCIEDYGFAGWNAFSNFGTTALDDPVYIPLLKKAAELNAVVYLHPTMSVIERLHGLGRQLIGSGLGFGIDVMITLERMILNGVFDKIPDLKVILGHLGEGFPYIMDRMVARGPKENRYPAVNEKNPKDYFKSNIWITTSGNYSEPAFICGKEVLGIDRILLGSDFPMEPLKKSVDFINEVHIDSGDRQKVLGLNALQLLNW